MAVRSFVLVLSLWTVAGACKKDAPPAPPPRPSTAAPGALANAGGPEVTCTQDQDCVLADRDACCLCCPMAPVAFNVATHEKMLEDCAANKCAACPQTPCPAVDGMDQYTAVCKRGLCMAMRRF